MDLLALIVSLAICFAAAGIGGLATAPAVRSWYPSLPKPPWTPPDRLFAPAWTALYVAMAVASWRVWTFRESEAVGVALALFAVQLALNVAWSVVFFGRRSPRGGSVVIAALWLAIAATLVGFWRIDLVAGALFVPYLAWVTFAAALNFSIARRTSLVSGGRRSA